MASSAAPAITESGHLESEAKDARAAISAALHDFKIHLSNGADPRVLTKKHPWMALGIAAVAGWVIGQVSVPTKRRSIFEHLKSAAPAPQKGGQNGNQGKGFFDSIIHEVIAIAKPAVVSAITGAFAGVKGAQHDADKEQPAAGAPVDISTPS